MTWWRRRPRHEDPPSERHPGNASIAAARRTADESQRRLDRDRARVDEWTGEIRKLLGGRS